MPPMVLHRAAQVKCWYDHLLTHDEVSALAKTVATQISQFGVNGVAFFAHPLAQDPDAQAYVYMDEMAAGRGLAGVLI